MGSEQRSPDPLADLENVQMIRQQSEDLQRERKVSGAVQTAARCLGNTPMASTFPMMVISPVIATSWRIRFSAFC